MFVQVSIPRETAGAGHSLLLCADASADAPELQGFAGQAQCVYMDPPFMTGGSFVRRRRFGTAGWRTGRPAPEYPGYEDQFPSREAYLAMVEGLIRQAHRLLKDTGVFCLHLDWRVSAYARILCDEIFGADMFLNEVVWAYESGGRARRYFSRKHDVILLYGRSKKYRFDLRKVPLERSEHRRNHMRRAVDEEGRAYRSIKSAGREYRYYDDEPVYPGDVWTDISHLQQKDPERTGFATQKPLKLLERLLKPLVEPGDLVCDLCCGSGTTLAAAQGLGCRVLGVDVSPEALMMTRSRLDTTDMTVLCPCENDDAMLEGIFDKQSGLLLLTGFHATHPAFPQTERAMDVLESWSAGRLAPQEMRVDCSFGRSVGQPELPLFCILPEGDSPACVSTVDAAGRRRTYVWKEM